VNTRQKDDGSYLGVIAVDRLERTKVSRAMQRTASPLG
jgi:hypothetical protein